MLFGVEEERNTKVFKNAGVVLNVKYNFEDEIVITFENNKLRMIAEGDCCSKSVFEQYGNFEFDKLIGKKILSVVEDQDETGEDIKEYENKFIVEDNQYQESEFPFRLINSSNGYYEGYIEYDWEKMYFDPSSFPSTAELVVVVGLPGAGKTSYVLHNYSGYHIYDDDDNPISNINYVIQELQEGGKVCIIEPRFTDYDIYQKNIREKILPLIGESRIRTILFNKDVENSHINNRRRIQESSDKALGSTRIMLMKIRNITLRKKNDIERMATYYSVDNDYINKEIVETYVKN